MIEDQVQPAQIDSTASSVSSVDSDVPLEQNVEGAQTATLKLEDAAASSTDDRSEIARRMTRKEKKALRAQRRLEARRAKLPIPRLTDVELQQRLTLSLDGLVEEIYNTAVRQSQVEDQRESRLDAKAQGLMGTASLSLTVAFTFGGILLQYPDYLTPLGTWPSRAIFALYALSLFCGLLACILAVRAL